MKNIFKTFISCIVLAVGVTSCYDEILMQNMSKPAISQLP